MGSGFAKRKKQMKAMQEQLLQMQQEMQTAQFEGIAGNGLVTVILNGELQLQKISIKPECIDPEDAEGLEDLISMAFADAQQKAKAASPEASIPGLDALSSLGF